MPNGLMQLMVNIKKLELTSKYSLVWRVSFVAECLRFFFVDIYLFI